MKITICKGTGSFILDLLPSDTIWLVKKKIMEKTGISPDEQILLYGSTILEDNNKTLFYYYVKEDSKISLIMQKPANEKPKVIPIYNPKLTLLPNITFWVDYNCTIDEKLYNNLKEELSEIIDKNNFSIIELRKGSIIMKIVLIGDLALKGIKASEYNDTSEEINSVLKKIESKKFVCLGNNNSSGSNYKIPDYSKEENRIQLVNFLKETSKINDDILQTSSTITDEEFENILEKTMKNVSDVVIAQEINQKKYILDKLEDFNNQIESILEESKKESIFEFGVAGISLINRDMSEYQNNKNKCNNLITKFLFHGTSSNSSSLIVTSNFRSANVAFFGPGVYMTDMLDYAGFYAFNPEDNGKFENHHRIRKSDETFTIVASQIFYDNSKFENCYDMTDKSIPKEGIRYINVNADGVPLSKNQTKE